MRLLVSVANAGEAAEALAGGADLIDAKNPLLGALGAVSLYAMRAIRASVDGQRPVTAAIGYAVDEATVERLAYAYTATGALFVKIGFAGITAPAQVTALTRAAVHGATRAGTGGVVAVAYADAPPSECVSTATLIDVAAAAGAAGVLLDTIDKHGPRLTALMTGEALTAFVTRTHDMGLLAALAGRLTADDLTLARDSGADVVGVRGAACEGDRTGRVTASRVRSLQIHLDGSTGRHREPVSA
jgi:hypothetical protein